MLLAPDLLFHAGAGQFAQAQQASDIESLKRLLGLSRFSLASFSEASGLFDPALLEPIIADQGVSLPTSLGTDPRLSALDFRPVTVDLPATAGCARCLKWSGRFGATTSGGRPGFKFIWI